MAKAKKAKEIFFKMENKVGLLSEITTAIAGAKNNISSICAYAMENNAYFILITENNAKAKKALGQLGIQFEERDVIEIEMPNKAGELQKVAKKIADSGINIEYIYGTAKLGKTATCILKTSDNKKAINVINK